MQYILIVSGNYLKHKYVWINVEMNIYETEENLLNHMEKANQKIKNIYDKMHFLVKKFHNGRK